MRKKTEKVIKNIEWPGSFELINQARKLMKVNIWNILTVFVGYFFIYLIIGQLTSKYAAVNRVVKSHGHQTTMVTDVKSYPALILFMLIMFLVYTLFYLLINYYSFKNIDSESVEISEAFTQSKKYYLRFLILSLVVIAVVFANIVLVGLLLSLIAAITSPGIGAIVGLVLVAAEIYFILPRLVLIYSLIIKEDLGVIDSVKKSWSLTDGYTNKIQLYVVSFLLWAFAAVFLAMTVIGIPLAIYIMMFLMSSPALLYNIIKSNK